MDVVPSIAAKTHVIAAHRFLLHIRSRANQSRSPDRPWACAATSSQGAPSARQKLSRNIGAWRDARKQFLFSPDNKSAKEVVRFAVRIARQCDTTRASRERCLFCASPKRSLQRDTSRGHGVTGSRGHGVTESRSHGVTGSRSHGVTGSRSHGVTESRGHGVTGSRSHANTVQETCDSALAGGNLRATLSTRQRLSASPITNSSPTTCPTSDLPIGA